MANSSSGNVSPPYLSENDPISPVSNSFPITGLANAPDVTYPEETTYPSSDEEEVTPNAKKTQSTLLEELKRGIAPAVDVASGMASWGLGLATPAIDAAQAVNKAIVAKENEGGIVGNVLSGLGSLSHSLTHMEPGRSIFDPGYYIPPSEQDIEQLAHTFDPTSPLEAAVPELDYAQHYVALQNHLQGGENPDAGSNTVSGAYYRTLAALTKVYNGEQTMPEMLAQAKTDAANGQGILGLQSMQDAYDQSDELKPKEDMIVAGNLLGKYLGADGGGVKLVDKPSDDPNVPATKEAQILPSGYFSRDADKLSITGNAGTATGSLADVPATAANLGASAALTWSDLPNNFISTVTRGVSSWLNDIVGKDVAWYNDTDQKQQKPLFLDKDAWNQRFQAILKLNPDFAENPAWKEFTGFFNNAAYLLSPTAMKEGLRNRIQENSQQVRQYDIDLNHAQPHPDVDETNFAQGNPNYSDEEIQKSSQAIEGLQKKKALAVSKILLYSRVLQPLVDPAGALRDSKNWLGLRGQDEPYNLTVASPEEDPQYDPTNANANPLAYTLMRGAGSDVASKVMNERSAPQGNPSPFSVGPALLAVSRDAQGNPGPLAHETVDYGSLTDNPDYQAYHQLVNDNPLRTPSEDIENNVINAVHSANEGTGGQARSLSGVLSLLQSGKSREDIHEAVTVPKITDQFNTSTQNMAAKIAQTHENIDARSNLIDSYVENAQGKNLEKLGADRDKAIADINSLRQKQLESLVQDRIATTNFQQQVKKLGLGDDMDNRVGALTDMALNENIGGSPEFRFNTLANSVHDLVFRSTLPDDKKVKVENSLLSSAKAYIGAKAKYSQAADKIDIATPRAEGMPRVYNALDATYNRSVRERMTLDQRKEALAQAEEELKQRITGEELQDIIDARTDITAKKRLADMLRRGAMPNILHSAAEEKTAKAASISDEDLQFLHKVAPYLENSQKDYAVSDLDRKASGLRKIRGDYAMAGTASPHYQLADQLYRAYRNLRDKAMENYTPDNSPEYQARYRKLKSVSNNASNLSIWLQNHILGTNIKPGQQLAGERVRSLEAAQALINRAVENPGDERTLMLSLAQHGLKTPNLMNIFNTLGLHRTDVERGLRHDVMANWKPGAGYQLRKSAADDPTRKPILHPFGRGRIIPQTINQAGKVIDPTTGKLVDAAKIPVSSKIGSFIKHGTESVFLNTLLTSLGVDPISAGLMTWWTKWKTKEGAHGFFGYPVSSAFKQSFEVGQRAKDDLARQSLGKLLGGESFDNGQTSHDPLAAKSVFNRLASRLSMGAYDKYLTPGSKAVLQRFFTAGANQAEQESKGKYAISPEMDAAIYGLKTYMGEGGKDDLIKAYGPMLTDAMLGYGGQAIAKSIDMQHGHGTVQKLVGNLGENLGGFPQWAASKLLLPRTNAASSVDTTSSVYKAAKERVLSNIPSPLQTSEQTAKDASDDLVSDAIATASPSKAHLSVLQNLLDNPSGDIPPKLHSLILNLYAEDKQKGGDPDKFIGKLLEKNGLLESRGYTKQADALREMVNEYLKENSEGETVDDLVPAP